jgi:localization factor PodJL
MAWNIAGVGRRSRDAAVEAARRAGMRLDDWLDQAIADYAGLDHQTSQDNEAEDDRLDAAAGRLERLARRNERAQAPREPKSSKPFDTVIERLEMRLARAEAQAARAFETVAQILERDNATRDRDRRALIDAVRRLESIRTNLTRAPRDGEAGGDRFPQPPGFNPEAPFDLKAAVSQIAMRRHELAGRAGHDETGLTQQDPRTAAFADASALSPANGNPGSPDADPLADDPRAEGGPDAAASLSQLLLDDIRALGLKLDDMRRERADPSASVDLGAMRGEIEAMSRSLADLAPRNAVVALEGAIRDLMGRVETLRQSGHGESMLAPLETMAAEFHAALRAHDPQAAAAGLEREIRAIGGKIDALSAAAIKPETFEPIRRQTEEVRNLLASAALRTPPLERLERQIGELADRVERLGASPAPHFESAEMAALLAEACRQIERSTPPAALASIERRLEHIAARLDQEIARPSAPIEINPGPFDDLARRIDGVRQSLERLPAATIDTGPIERLLHELAASGRPDADALALQSIFAEISDKLDRLADPGVGPRQLDPVLHELGARLDAVASPVDLNPIEALLRSLEAKLEARPAEPIERQVVEQVADEIARRLHDVSARQVDLEAVAQQIDTISDRIDALAVEAARADEPGPVVQELLEKLREAEKADGSSALETSAAVHAALDTHLSELKAEQASADQRTQSRLADLQGVLETLATRLASIESELTADDVDDELRPPTRSRSPASPLSSASPAADVAPEAAPQRMGQDKPASAEDQPPQPIDDGEDFLIEPGAGAPQRAREARDLAQVIGPKTNPAVSVHIAAARRAAQAALAENNAAISGGGVVQTLAASERMQFAARGVQSARVFYASHKRTVLLGVALAIATTLAVRMVGVRAPFLQRSEVGGQAVNTAKVDAPKGKPSGAGAVKPSGEAIDVAPTASIAQPPIKPDGRLAPESGPRADDLMAAIPPGISASLRDATAAGQPGAQYELAMRLFEGRGLPKDQPAAARWFERAASLGLAPAQYRLGSMYEKGIGVTRDPGAAKRWYLKAAEAGNARAAHNLAVMDTDAAAGEPNYVEAVKWFRTAGELGVRDSQYNLAILYARGLGVEKDLGQSWLWFALAAQQGDADAATKRDEIAREMDPASLASAVEALMKFKAAKPDPTANEVTAPPGGWDAKGG